jgi:hypothetical protein
LVTPAAVHVRLLPVSASVVATMSKVPALELQFWIFVIDCPMSGMIDGNGTETPAPPK